MIHPNSNEAKNLMFLFQTSPVVISAQLHDVCYFVDPTVHPWVDLMVEQNEIPLEKVVACATGIHLAFWIMKDELHKFPTNQVERDALIFKVLRVIDMKTAKDTELKNSMAEELSNKLSKVLDNEDKQLWLQNLTHLLSVSIGVSCISIIMLTHLWDHLQLQEEFRQTLEKDKSSS